MDGPCVEKYYAFNFTQTRSIDQGHVKPLCMDEDVVMTAKSKAWTRNTYSSLPRVPCVYT